jgi:hypothetical protein
MAEKPSTEAVKPVIFSLHHGAEAERARQLLKTKCSRLGIRMQDGVLAAVLQWVKAATR